MQNHDIMIPRRAITDTDTNNIGLKESQFCFFEGGGENDDKTTLSTIRLDHHQKPSLLIVITQ